MQALGVIWKKFWQAEAFFQIKPPPEDQCGTQQFLTYQERSFQNNYVMGGLAHHRSQITDPKLRGTNGKQEIKLPSLCTRAALVGPPNITPTVFIYMSSPKHTSDFRLHI